MIREKRILAIIPARGGSKGVPRKNIRDLAGRPLIAWTIASARESKYLDRLIVSTEDEEIASIARQFGAEVPFMRPPELAQDGSSGIDPVIHALETLPEKYDYMVLLQPTSPFRNAEDIDQAIELCIGSGAESCVSVTENSKSPYWAYKIDPQKRLEPLFPVEEKIACRQQLPKTYAQNGAIFVASCAFVLATASLQNRQTLAYIMPPERSLDIDSELDLRLANLLLTT